MRNRILSSILSICFIISLFAVMSFSAGATNIVSRDWLWPVPASNRLSSCFGDGRSHNAIDIAAPKGSDIIASMSGTVVKTYTSCPNNYPKSGNCPCGGCLNLGNYVYIEHTYNGKSYISRYGHLTDVYVSVGDTVTAGEGIGTVGSTGRSTGYHLDFQIYQGTLSSRVRYVDPLKEPFLQPIEGLNANAASTSCCYEYVDEVYSILSNETSYKDLCQVTACENTIGIATAGGDMMSLPCTSDVFSSSFKISSYSQNTKFTVTEKIVNSEGENWLYVETSTGEKGYIKANNVSLYNVFSGYSRYTATTNIAYYPQPSSSSSSSGTYSSGTTIKIVGSLLGTNGTVWYITDSGYYIPASSVTGLTYTSSLKFTGTPYPYDSLTEGKSQSISGTVSSDNTITKISAMIIDSNGKTIINESVTCNTNYYSFRGSDLDYAIPFSTVPAGTYTYVLSVTETAYDASGKSYSLTTTLKNTFAVGGTYKTESVYFTDPDGTEKSVSVGSSYSTASKYDKITISNYNYPTQLEVGSSFSIYGTVTSQESRLQEVAVIVRDASGNAVIHESGSTNSTSYSISALDNYVRFGQLSAGVYTYEIEATNASGATQLLCKQFTVVDSSLPPDGGEEGGDDGGDVQLPEGSLDNFVKIRQYNDRFVDVSHDQWYYTNVNIGYRLGIINGSSDTEYMPDTYLTVAECITLAVNLHNIYYGNNADFTQSDVWYDVYIDYAVKYGIIDYSDYSDFDAYATRAQVAKIFAAALPDEAFTVKNQISDGAIPDVSMSADYANDVYKLYRAGVLLGNDEFGTFAPNSNILRCEIAAIVSRIAVTDLRLEVAL